MRGIGRSLGWMAAALAFVAGSLLLPSAASAQFNIEGIIRGAVGNGCCYGGYRHHVERSDSSHHARHSKDDDADSSDKSSDKSKDKEKDATQEQPATTTASAQHQQPQPSGSTHDAQRSSESDASAKPTPSSSGKSYDDQPAFSPMR